MGTAVCLSYLAMDLLSTTACPCCRGPKSLPQGVRDVTFSAYHKDGVSYVLDGV